MPTIHALLIGVDHYLPKCLPDGKRYPDLKGAVRDILYTEGFLKTTLSVPPANIVKLLSVNPETDQEVDDTVGLPSYANMVKEFRALRDRAAAGDQVYIHYSGHGGRVKTIYQDRKGPGGLDEALVPHDIHKSGSQYLRDLEVAALLDELKEKKLNITVVLDCCHSGGTTRGPADEVGVRGVDFEDHNDHDGPVLVEIPKDLATRGLTTPGGPLPEPEGYTLLAACAPEQLAREFAFDGKAHHGALTYWLIESLQRLTPTTTYRILQNRMLARIRSQFAEQTPMLEGDAGRVVFGIDTMPPVLASSVLEVDPVGRKVKIATGQSMGVTKGARFGIYAPGADLTTPKGRKLVVTLTGLGSIDSVAEPEADAGFGEPPVARDDLAVLIGAGSPSQVRGVRVVNFDTTPADPGAAPFKAIFDALGADTSGLLQLQGDRPVDFRVSVSKDGSEYQILDRSDVIRNLRPVLKVSDPHAPATVVARLIHLIKFRNVEKRMNEDFDSTLNGKLSVEVVGWQQNYTKGDAVDPKPFPPMPGNILTLKVGQTVWVKVRNDSPGVLNVTVLDLEPDWAISQAYPLNGADWFPLDPGAVMRAPHGLPMTASLPDGYDEGREVIKFFATKGPSTLRNDTLPPLDRPVVRSKGDETRGMVVPTGASDDWTVVQLEFKIVR